MMKTKFLLFTTIAFCMLLFSSVIANTQYCNAWNNLTSGTTNVLTDVYFTSIDNGYVVGAGGVTRKTTDSGTTRPECGSTYYSDYDKVYSN